jgi:hypothetical protein
MNTYVSDPCLVYKKMATDGGGGEVDSDSDDCERNFGPWFKSLPGYFFFANFHVTAILAISTKRKPNI